MTSSALEIAHGALLDLESAKRALLQIETLMCVAVTGEVNPAHFRTLVEIAWGLAVDAANVASCNYEEISLALDELAPQNVEVPNRGANLSGGDLGKRILAARENASLGQDELAKMVGLEQTSISQLETGRTKRTSYLAEIARACGVDVNWLAFGSEGAQ